MNEFGETMLTLAAIPLVGFILLIIYFMVPAILLALAKDLFRLLTTARKKGTK